MSRELCADEDRSSFRIASSILTFIILASGFGMGFFIYQLIVQEISHLVDGIPISIDNVTPPYIGIICIAIFIAAWVGFWHVRKVERSVCGRPF